MSTPFLAPTYFPPSYFYGPSSSPVIVPVGSAPPGRDGAAYASMVSLLEATGAFQGVVFGDSLRRDRAGADAYPLAIVTPTGWEESDDSDPARLVRRASFAITIVVKDDDGASPFEALDGLAAAVQGVVDLSDLGGTSLPALTKVRAGRYGQADRHPERSVELDGEFSTLIDPSDPDPSR